MGLELPRLVLFLFFAFLSAFSFRLIPFFAIVAGPIAVLNFQDAFRGSAATTRYQLALGVRVGALVAGVALLLCAWPGWLHSSAGNWRFTRHVAWGVAEDPGVLQAAQTIRQVQMQSGLCKLGCTYSIDAGNVFAWVALRSEPTLKLFGDSRYAMPLERAEAYGKIRRGLLDESQAMNAALEPDKAKRDRYADARRQYQRAMRQSGVDYVVLTAVNNDAKTHAIAQHMLADHAQWALLYHDGRTAVFGWLDPDPAKRTASEPYRALRLDLDSLATPPTMPPNVPRVVLEGAGVAPPPKLARDDWQQYLLGPDEPALSTAQAAQYFELYKRGMDSWPVGGIDLALAGAGPPAIWANFAKRDKAKPLNGTNQQGQPVPLFRPKDIGPTGALIAAVRAGRNAAMESASDFAANYWLGAAYQVLGDNHEQLGWVRRPPEPTDYRWDMRHQLRHMQVLTAWNNAAAIQPDNWHVHLHLHELYARLQYLDLSLEHLLLASQAVATRKSTDPAEADEAERFKKAYTPEAIKRFSAEIVRRESAYQARVTGDMAVLKRFELALFDPDSQEFKGRAELAPRGLVKRGLIMLLEAKIDEFKHDPDQLRFFAYWQLYLLLTTGQAREASSRMAEEEEQLRQLLSGGKYEQLRGLAAAALGDYRTADKYLEQAEKAVGLAGEAEILRRQTQITLEMAEQLAAACGSMPAGDGFIGSLSRLAAFQAQQQELFKDWPQRREVGELRLARGLLAVESGDSKAAAEHFKGCLAILPAAVNFPDRPVAQRVSGIAPGEVDRGFAKGRL